MRLTTIILGGLLLAGCGNVCLQGDALTAAEAYTIDAYHAVVWATNATGDGPEATEAATQRAVPPVIQAYLIENFKQWRFIVRSAKKDPAWGPKLVGEQ